MSRTEALAFLNIAHFFDHFFLLIFPTAALAIAPAWGMTYADVLLLGSPLYAMFALGTLPAGWLGDRMDRMTLIAVFFIGGGGAALWTGLATGPLPMAAGLGALGLFAAIYHPVGLAQVTQIGQRTGRALAVNGVFGNMGLAGAALATGFLARFLGWEWAFLVPGGLSLLIGLLLLSRLGQGWRLNHRWRMGPLRRVERSDPAAPGAGETGIAAPATPDPRVQATVFAVVCISALLGGLIFNGVTLSLPKFFDERLVGNPAGDLAGNLAWVGASAGLVFAVAAFAQLPVGELLDRIGARPVLLSLLGAQALLLTALAEATGATALFLALLLVTAVFAEIPITTWLIGRYLAPGIRSRAVSVEYVLSLGVGSAAVPLIALAHDRGIGFNGQFIGLAVAALAILAAALFLPKEKPRAHRPFPGSLAG